MYYETIITNEQGGEPFTLRSVVWFVSPASFLISQVKEPRCTELTASIFSMDVFLLIVVSTMPIVFRGWISSPLNSHLNRTGRSPLLITHETDAVSPSFSISSPNSKGVICGGTEVTLHSVISGI